MADRQTLKRSMYEAALIALSAAILGLVYNSVSPRGIDLIRKDQPTIWSTDTSRHPTASNSRRPTFIDADEALRIFQRGNALFIDARHDDDFKEGHIKGAISLPLRTLETNPTQVQGLSKDTLIVTYCSGERCALSIDLGERLASMGFTNVKVFFSGWLEWQKRNLPTETGPRGNS
ncbi:MAG: rhodanese-like domain-containing protein [Bacteroidota bacterium]